MTSVTTAGAGTANNPNLQGIHATGDGQISYNGVTMSVFAAFELLCIDRAHTFSDLTSDQLGKANANLKDIKKARDYLNQMRTLKDKGGIQRIPKDMKDFCTKHGIKIPDDDDDLYGPSEFGTAIDNMQSQLDSFQDTNQIAMLKLKTRINNMDTSITAASKTEEKIFSLCKDIINGIR